MDSDQPRTKTLVDCYDHSAAVDSLLELRRRAPPAPLPVNVEEPSPFRAADPEWRMKILAEYCGEVVAQAPPVAPVAVGGVRPIIIACPAVGVFKPTPKVRLRRSDGAWVHMIVID